MSKLVFDPRKHELAEAVQLRALPVTCCNRGRPLRPRATVPDLFQSPPEVFDSQ